VEVALCLAITRSPLQVPPHIAGRRETHHGRRRRRASHAASHASRAVRDVGHGLEKRD
jgi:hypothetical protein